MLLARARWLIIFCRFNKKIKIAKRNILLMKKLESWIVHKLSHRLYQMVFFEQIKIRYIEINGLSFQHNACQRRYPIITSEFQTESKNISQHPSIKIGSDTIRET